MPDPDLSNIKALIAHDRPEVRGMLSDRLRELGVRQIDAMAAGVGGTNLVALMTPATTVPEPDTSAEAMSVVVSRFSHDVASPLMCVLALSGLLVREAKVDEQTNEDLKRIQAAAEEIAVMVRTLGERASPRNGRQLPTS